MEVKAEYRTIFCEEAADQLREWEGSLLALEKNPQDGDAGEQDVPRRPHVEGFGGIHRL